MSRAGFYSDNELRNYPFVGSGELPLLDTVIVDFGCIMGPQAGFVSGVDKIYLYQITRYEDLFRFEFKCTASGLVGRSLIFEFHISDAEYSTRYTVDDISLGSSSAVNSSSQGLTEVRWEGFLVVGKVADAAYSMTPLTSVPNGVILWRNATEGILWSNGGYLLEQIVNIEIGASVNDENQTMVVEPALTQNLAGTYVERINLANKKRTMYSPPEGCSLSSEVSYDLYYVNATDIVGDVKVKEGYNSNIFVSKAEYSITFAAGVGIGMGEPCSEFVFYENEQSPDGNMLTGGPNCGETIKSINGITGRVINIQGGLGVRVEAGLGNKLVVTPDHNGLALCANIQTSSVGG